MPQISYFIYWLSDHYSECKFKNQTLVTLREDTELLDEVVVVGYGTMKKKDLLGATSMVSGDQLATNSSISVGGALQGKMSGINILSSSWFSMVQKL